MGGNWGVDRGKLSCFGGGITVLPSGLVGGLIRVGWAFNGQ